jgi:hypothetical protein
MSGDDPELNQDRRRIGRGWLNHATEDLYISNNHSARDLRW